MTKSPEIIRMIGEGKTAREIVEELGVSRQLIYQLAAKLGLKINAPPIPPYKRKMSPRIRTGGVGIEVNCVTAGAIGELLAAADLMARGWTVFMPVYRSMVHDLVGIKDDEIKTFEVRCGRRNLKGQVNFSKRRPGKSNHFAVIITGEPVHYVPDIDISKG